MSWLAYIRIELYRQGGETDAGRKQVLKIEEECVVKVSDTREIVERVGIENKWLTLSTRKSNDPEGVRFMFTSPVTISIKTTPKL